MVENLLESLEEKDKIWKNLYLRKFLFRYNTKFSYPRKIRSYAPRTAFY